MLVLISTAIWCEFKTHGVYVLVQYGVDSKHMVLNPQYINIYINNIIVRIIYTLHGMNPNRYSRAQWTRTFSSTTL